LASTAELFTQELLDLLLDVDPIVRTAAAKQLHLRSEPSIFNKVCELSSNERDEVREISAFVMGNWARLINLIKRHQYLS
jgi:hypothetical protein